jgi:hypothetical protein
VREVRHGRVNVVPVEMDDHAHRGHQYHVHTRPRT